MFRTSTPPIRTPPLSASQKEAMSRAMVDLPEPEGPTMAVIPFFAQSKEIPCKTSVSLYRKVT